MKINSLSKIIIVILSICIFSSFTISVCSQEEMIQLVCLGGQLGGSYDLHAAAIAEAVRRTYPNIRITPMPGGGTSNVPLVSQGEAELGFTHNNVALGGELGIEPYNEKWTGLRAITTTSLSAGQIVALASEGIDSMKQIAENKIPIKASVGTIGSTTSLAFKRLFEAYGFTFADVESWGGKIYYEQASEACDLMSMGRVNIQFTSGSVPLAYLQEIATKFDLKMLPVDDEQIEAMREFGYGRAVIPEGAYTFVKEDIPAWAINSILFCNESLSEEIVYKITRAIVENLPYIYYSDKALERMTADTMWEDTGVQLHPGAERYYREIGAIK